MNYHLLTQLLLSRRLYERKIEVNAETYQGSPLNVVNPRNVIMYGLYVLKEFHVLDINVTINIKRNKLLFVRMLFVFYSW